MNLFNLLKLKTEEVVEKAVFVQVPVSLYNDIVVRHGGVQADVESAIKAALREYLERTGTSNAPAPAPEKTPAAEPEPVKGFQWSNVFLPNGTKIRMTYKGVEHTAEVSKERMKYKGKYFSPSALASRIAAGTSRNSWRDLWIKRPGDKDFIMADELRQSS